MRYASMPMLEGGDSSPTSVYGHPGAASGKRQTRRTSRLFSSEDLRTPEPLEKLLSTIETGRDEIGGNVVRLKAWLSHQQHEVQGWLRKQQPRKPLRSLSMKRDVADYFGRRCSWHRLRAGQ